MVEKIPLIGRFFRGRQKPETTDFSLQTKPGVIFNPEDSLVSFYVAGNDPEEKIREQLAGQFPRDPEKIGRIMEQIKEKREKRAGS